MRPINVTMALHAPRSGSTLVSLFKQISSQNRVHFSTKTIWLHYNQVAVAGFKTVCKGLTGIFGFSIWFLALLCGVSRAH